MASIPSGGPVDPALIDDLVAASRILAQHGVLDAWGHVSMRHPKNPDRYLISRARAPALVAATDIVELDLNSDPVDQNGPRLFLERYIHGEAYKARPDVNSVIHTHSAGVIPFSVTQVPLRPVLHNASFLHVGVRSGKSATPAAPPTCWCATATSASPWPRRSATSRSR